MRPFAYCAPSSVDEAVALLVERGERARPLAGGTDLLIQLRRRLLELDLVVDVKAIPELSRITFDPGDGLTVGAAVSCARLCEHTEVARHYPCLVDAASIVGGAAIQERATLGGNLCNAAPSGDTIPALMVLEATCTVAGPNGLRTVPVASFCSAPGQTVLGRGELLVSIHISPPVAHAGACYLRFTPRHEMDLAVAGAGAWVQLSDAKVTDARIALGAVAPTPLLVESAGTALVGKAPDEDALAQAARLCQDAARPISDVRGTAQQRRHLVGVLVRRALRAAARRARGEEARVAPD